MFHSHFQVVLVSSLPVATCVFFFCFPSPYIWSSENPRARWGDAPWRPNSAPDGGDGRSPGPGDGYRLWYLLLLLFFLCLVAACVFR